MRVKAKNEAIAKHIRHLPSGVRFRDGVANWPNDQFTKRRIRDGDVEAVDDAEEPAVPAKKGHHHSPRAEPAESP